MYLDDFLEEFIVKDEEELIKLLKVRHNYSANNFILTHNENGFPQLNIFVRDDKFVLYYMVDGKNYVSTGNNSTQEETYLFYENNNGSKVALPCSCIVKEQAMETAALEFFKQKSFPKNIHWQEL